MTDASKYDEALPDGLAVGRDEVLGRLAVIRKLAKSGRLHALDSASIFKLLED